MQQRDVLTRRSGIEWVVRGAIGVIAAVLGYFCVTQALAQVVARRDAAFAYRLAPGTSQATARLAISLAGAEATTADRRRADALAREALLRDATAVLAVATLGSNAEVRGERERARRLFDYAQKLSRRDLPTQFWAIENAVARNDIAGALRHYDIALRTSSATAADLLYPVLASASADPEIRVALVKVLAAKPSWSESFISYIAGRGPDPRSTAALFLSLRRAGVAVPESAHAPIINALIARGFIGEAWRYYASLNPDADRRLLRNPRFAINKEAPSLFDWVAVNDGSVTTSIQSGLEGGMFDFAAPASVGGPLLQQLQLLPPGTYRMAGHSNGIDQEERARPYWALSCRQNGAELGRVPLPNSTQGGGNFVGSFTVPASCPIQVLTLVARPSDAVAGLSGQIDYVQLAPIR